MTGAGLTGFYGKVATRGDFVSRRLPRAFIDPWDRWLQQGMACSRDQLGGAWLDTYLTSPVWHFALSPGVCGDSGWLGVLLPSVDRVGRYFPLTVAHPVPGLASALAVLGAAADWLRQAEGLGLSALEDRFDLDAFDNAVAALSAPQAGSAPSPASAATSLAGWHFPAGGGTLGGAAVADTLLTTFLPLHSAWSSRGSDLVGPSLAIARALPPPAAFAALLDGAWARWGWASVMPPEPVRGDGSFAAAAPTVAVRATTAAVASDPPVTAQPMRWRAAASTHKGNVRQHNEDSYRSLTEQGIWVVADGMGGHADGDIASREVVRSLESLPRGLDLESLAAAARTALDRVNRELRERAALRASVIGSTVVVLLARGARATCLWAGDSRIYLYRDGALRPLTRDHSVVEELVLRGQLSAEHALAHPEANALTRAVGGDDRLEIDGMDVDVLPGDLFLLCTDGLTKEVDHSDMARILAAAGDLERACEGLVRQALANGGRDNVTVIAVRADPGTPNAGPVLGR